MTAEIILFVPRPNPSRKESPAFDAYDHRTIDYTTVLPPSELTPTDPPKDPA